MISFGLFRKEYRIFSSDSPYVRAMLVLYARAQLETEDQQSFGFDLA